MRPFAGTALPLAILFSMFHAPAVFADAKSELRFQQGVAAYGAREFGASREAFENFVDENPDDPTALRYLGLLSRHEGKDEEAIEFFTRALKLAPTDVLTYMALGETQLKAQQNVPAQLTLNAALTLAPQHARLHLYMGIAKYRLRDFSGAATHFERATALDSNLEREARYYSGLTQAVLGNLYAAAQAFTDVARDSPAHPLGRSALNLRTAMEPETPEERWTVSATAGMEFDTNPTLAPKIAKENSDAAGSLGFRGLYDVYRGDGITLRAGYDGFFLKHISENEIDEQTHVVRGLAQYDYRNVRLTMRYNGSITLLEFDDTFRSLHTIEPAVSVRVGNYGVLQTFFQTSRFDFFNKSADPDFELDGWQHKVGLTHSFIPPDPLSHIRLGVDATLRDTKGSEFEHIALSANVGAGFYLPWQDIEISGLYRFSHLDFAKGSRCTPDGRCNSSDDATGIKRNNIAHEVTFNVNVPVWRRLSLDVAAALFFEDSKIDEYRYDRQIVGTYLTWDFGGKRPVRRTARDADTDFIDNQDEGKFPGE